MSSYYPELDDAGLFYVEFERGEVKGEFTLFQRQFMYSPQELDRLKKEDPQHAPFREMCNEVHPWNLFTATYGPDGCMPDRKWIEWMVDALNNYNKSKKD